MYVFLLWRNHFFVSQRYEVITHKMIKHPELNLHLLHFLGHSKLTMRITFFASNLSLRA